MTIPEIIDALTPYTGSFPKGALEAAIEQKVAITPHLLRTLDEVAETPEKFTSNELSLHVFAIYLLAQFRDQRAYRPLTRILALPGNIADDLFGDTIPERLKNILASVYDGDPEPIKRLIEGEDLYEYVRGAGVGAFVVLAHTEQIPRLEVVDYFQSLLRGKLSRESEQVWNELACAVADLPAPELLDDLRKAYEEDLVDPLYTSLEEVEEGAGVPFAAKSDWKREESNLVTDAIGEMEWWAAFDGDSQREESEIDDEFDDLLPGGSESGFAPGPEENYVPSVPVRSGPKIGRNDPCPCGSGKKYKKCCLAAG